MKHYTIYECEICGRSSVDREAILFCEARHYGLTVEQKLTWDSLRSKVDNNIGKNSVQELEKFEQRHKLDRNAMQ
jgi:molecular chaperone DnaK (HSP70)